MDFKITWQAHNVAIYKLSLSSRQCFTLHFFSIFASETGSLLDLNRKFAFIMNFYNKNFELIVFVLYKHYCAKRYGFLPNRCSNLGADEFFSCLIDFCNKVFFQIKILIIISETD